MSMANVYQLSISITKKTPFTGSWPSLEIFPVPIRVLIFDTADMSRIGMSMGKEDIFVPDILTESLQSLISGNTGTVDSPTDIR